MGVVCSVPITADGQHEAQHGRSDAYDSVGFRIK